MSLCRTSLVAFWKAKNIQEDCLKFYVSSVSYLQSQLCFDNSLLAYAQDLNPEEKLDPGSTSAISNLVLDIRRVMKNCLQPVSGVSSSETVEGLCGSIHTQWQVYQTELVPEDWYKNHSEENAPSSLRTQHSCWLKGLHQIPSVSWIFHLSLHFHIY